MPTQAKKQITKDTAPETVQKDAALKKKPLLHDMKGTKEKKPMKLPKMSKKFIGAAAVIILLGVLSGFGLAKLGGGGGIVTGGGEKGEGGLQKTVGINDVKDKDEAEGKLVEGGIENEGTHHLERPGGPSQDVYLTSSVVPLDDYVGKNVKVWGDTFAAQSAGWLMDVVKLELLE